MHIQIFAIFRVLTYIEPRYVQNPVKVYSGIFRTLCKARILRTLPFSELCHFQNFGIFRTRGIFKILFIKLYSGIFNNDSYDNINFLFFTLISSSLFREEINAFEAVHTRSVVDACDSVQSIILLHHMMGTALLLVLLTRLIVSEPKHWVTWPHRTGLNFARAINCTRKFTCVCACTYACDCTRLKEPYT